MVRGQTAVKIAQTPDDINAAISEFQQALIAAPWLADGYYDLGTLQEKAKYYAGAIWSLKLYLLCSPKAEDAETVRQKVFELEYLQERASRESAPPLGSANPSGTASAQTIRTVSFDVAHHDGLSGVCTGTMTIGNGMLRFHSSSNPSHSFEIQLSEITEVKPKGRGLGLFAPDLYDYVISFKNGKRDRFFGDNRDDVLAAIRNARGQN